MKVPYGQFRPKLKILKQKCLLLMSKNETNNKSYRASVMFKKIQKIDFEVILAVLAY